MEESEPLLVIDNLRTYYDTFDGVVKAVDGVDLTLNRKEIIGLVGESGSGKTTISLSIMRLLPTFCRIISGSILFDMRDLVQLTEEEMRRVRGGRIGMVFQDPSTFLDPVMRIGDQIVEGIKAHQNVTQEEAKSRAVELLNMTNVPEPSKICNSFPHQLSGGMRQRAMIAIALSCNPSLVIADEPTSALDATVQLQIIGLLKQLAQRMGTSVLLITHNMGLVAELCERVCMVYAGKIVEDADIGTIFGKPRHPYTQGLLESMPSVQKHKEKLKTIEGNVPDLISPPNGCRFHPRCPYKMAICSKQEPPMKNDHSNRVACWLYEKGG